MEEHKVKRITTKLLAGLLLGSVLFAGCGSKTETTAKTEDAKAESQKEEAEELLSGTYTAEIVIKDYGTIVFDMDADRAPITVTNFVNLAEDGFYDGLTFHRIIDGFMMQGGDPNGNGTGGSDKNIKGEFKSNGVDNDQSHTRGAVSMARSNDKNSASSQFFIVHEDSDFLDGEYAVFGYVTEGIEVVDEICTTVPVEDGNGTVASENQPVIESITIISE